MKIVLAALFTLCCLSLTANFVQNKTFEFIQPDGTKLNLFVTGDEYYRRMHDANGYTILIHPHTGYAVYALPDGNEIQASDFAVGGSDPAMLGIEPNLMKYPAESERLYQEQLENRRNLRTPTTGLLDNVVCFVRFHDQTEFPTSHNYDWYDDLFNSDTQSSMRNYYFEVSDNQLDLYSYLYSSSGSNILSLQVGHDRDYYRPYNEVTNPDGYHDQTELTNRHRDLLGELCGMLDPLVPTGVNVDGDGDNRVDALTFVFRGTTDGNAGILWPAFWTWTASVGTINGKEVWSYVFDFDDGIGTSVICHEMGHVLGLPDLYRYNDHTIEPVRYWSLMSNDNAQHMTAYEKIHYLNWAASIPLIIPTQTPTQYTLTSVYDSPFSCYKISSTIQGQYYVLEYRRQMGRYETGVPGTGLIVYRVTESLQGEQVSGNAFGPPDEIYVYRPDGWINHNGYLNDAHFNASFGRTEIHNYTNPSPFLYDTAYTPTLGNLVITDVGSAQTWNSTITFKVSEFAPNVWTGAFSAGWGVYSNWSQNSVPTSDQYVIIPNGLDRYPIVSGLAECANLTVAPGASLRVHTGELYVGGNLNNYGILEMIDNAGQLEVQGDLIFHPGSAASITASPVIQLYQDLHFSEGTAISLGTSTLEFWGNTNSNIIINAAATLGSIHCHKDVGHISTLSGPDSTNLTINGNLHVYGDNKVFSTFAGNIMLYGDLCNYYGGAFQFDAGALVMAGNLHSYINPGPASNKVYDLTISKGEDYSVTLTSELTVTNHLTINSGTLEAVSATLYVQGNWYNLVGPAAFTEGTGTVIFSGSADQYCPFSEDFYNFELRKTGGRFLVYTTMATITCAHFDWTAGSMQVDYGTFTANDLADNGIFGSWKVANDGTVNLCNYNGFVDLNGSLDIVSGVFNVYGGTDDSYWSYSSNTYVTLSGGTLDFHDVGICIENSDYNFSENITAGKIRTTGHFYIDRAEFTPAGGEIELYGSLNSYVSQVTGANLWSLYINKSAPRSGLDKVFRSTDRFGRSVQLQRSNTVTANSNLTILGNFFLQNGAFNSPPNMTVHGNWTNSASPSAFNEYTGVVTFAGTGYTNCNTETFYQLELNKGTGGIFNINSENTVSCGIYNWTAGTLHVIGGSFTAQDLADDGIYGTIQLSTGYIELHQDAFSYVDLRCNLTIQGGEMHIHGGTDNMLWPYVTASSLTMTSGILEVHDRLIYVNTGPGFTTDISGGTIRADQGFYCNRGDFNPTGGTLEMHSAEDANLNMMAGSLYNLRINKTAARADELEIPIGSSTPFADRPFVTHPQTRSNTVTLLNSVSCHDLDVDFGTFNTNGYDLNCSGHCFIQDGGVFNFGSGGTLTMTNSSNLYVWSGGVFYAYGTSSVPTTVTCASGTFTFSVESGGTVGAEYTVFEKVGGYGVNVKPGATVDPAHSFTSCTFRNGAAYGTLLTLDTNQNLLISNAVFPSNTWTSSSNVTKSVNSGVTNFANATGAFSGEAYDNDVYSRLVWTSPSGSYDLQIVKAVWSKPKVAVGDTVILKVTCLNAGTQNINSTGIVIDLYYNQASAPNPGDFGNVWIFPEYFPAGLPVDYCFTVCNADTLNEGQWNSWLQIDTDQYVPETNELNNIHGPFHITWIYLTAITDLSIQYMGRNSFRLHWSYPEPCDGVMIYRSTSPVLEPVWENFLAVVDYPYTYFYDTVYAPHYFYLLTTWVDDDPQEKSVSGPVALPARQESDPDMRTSRTYHK